MSFALALKPPLVLVQVVPRVELAPVVRQAPVQDLPQTLPVTPPPRSLYHSILQWLVVLEALVALVEWVDQPLHWVYFQGRVLVALVMVVVLVVLVAVVVVVALVMVVPKACPH